MMNLLKIATGSVLSVLQKEAGRRYLAEQFAGIPGVPMKAQQLFDRSVETKRSPNAGLELEEVKEYLKESSSELYSEIESIESAFSFASLGQVHRARLRSRAPIVIKIQYPGLTKEIESQMKWILRGARLSPAARYGFDFREYEDVLLKALREELDYRNEAENQDRFRRLAESLKFVRVPRVFRDFSNEKVLVEEAVEGLHLDQLTHLNLEVRSKVAQHLKNFLKDSWVRFGFIHCDLHPQNWAYDLLRDQLIVYDFGSCYELSATQRFHFSALIEALEQTDSLAFLKSMKGLGFNIARWESTHESIMRWLTVHFIRLGFCKGGNRDSSAVDLDSKLAWAFRSSGPAWLFLPQRSFFYLARVLSKLSPGDETQSKTEQAQKLNVLVEQAAETIVELELPATAARSLRDILPEQALDRLRLSGSSVEEIQDRLERSYYRPQILFDENDRGKRLKVWLS